ADNGPNVIIAVDLDEGGGWRLQHVHPSTKGEKGFLPAVEGRTLMPRPPNGPPSHLAMGADGIAISHDGKRLFYCALASRRIYSVSVDALTNLALSDAEVGRTVVDHGE